MRYRGIIYDLDGTLLHSIEDIADAANFVLLESGLKTHPAENYIKWIGNGAYKLIERALPENYRHENTVTGFHIKFVNRYRQNWNVKSRLYDGISETLHVMQSLGFSQSVLSNKPHLLTVNVAEYYLNAWNFACIFGQREEIPKKPDPTAAFEIAEITKIRPGEYIYVGDSSTDMKTARAAGMLAVGVTWGYDTEKNITEAGADFMVTNPEQLRTLIGSLN